MPTKQEMAQDLNSKLGTDLEWDKMLKEDLERFVELVDSEEFVYALVKEKASEKAMSEVEKAAGNWEPGKVLTEVLL